jgi:hypothetical protein
MNDLLIPPPARVEATAFLGYSPIVAGGGWLVGACRQRQRRWTQTSHPRGGGASFEFVFNHVNFSDRELWIEVVSSDDVPGLSGYDSGRDLADWARQHKHRREELLEQRKRWVRIFWFGMW